MSIFYNNYNPNKKYTFGCVIGFYNRIELLKQTIDSINDSFLPNDLLFILVDDNSENKNYSINLDHDYILIRKDVNRGIASSLAIGWDILNYLNVDFLLNIDSDTIVSHNWLSALLNTYYETQTLSHNRIITGFNGNHKTIKLFDTYQSKETVGGINIFFHQNLYHIIKKALSSYRCSISSIDDVINNIDNYRENPTLHNKYSGWDWSLVPVCQLYNIKIYSTHKSVVQHTGTCGMNSEPSHYEHSLDYENIKVPKIIHQLWKNNKLPDHLKIMQESVLCHHSEYEYKFWTDETLDEFITTYHPSLKPVYDYKFQYIIQKIDFIRLLLLYHYGGIYLDIDNYCMKNLDDLLIYPCTLAITDKNKAFKQKHYSFVLNNAFIISEQYNHFIKSVLYHIINYTDPPDYREFCHFNVEHTKILKSAGPLCITDVYQKYMYKSMINLIPKNYYIGVEYEHGTSIMNVIHDLKNVSKDAYALHLHESSWWKNTDNGNSPKNPLFNTNYPFFA